MKTFIADYERAMKSDGHDPHDGTPGSWRDLLRRTCERWRHQLRESTDDLTVDDLPLEEERP